MPARSSGARTSTSIGQRKPDATASSSTEAPAARVARLGPAGGARQRAAHALLTRFGLHLRPVPADAAIPGSYWGEPEAGLVDGAVHARADTPLHSLLHESCHFICMDPARRAALHTDAGGSSLEECAVCYLSIVLADHLPGFGRGRMLEDMDTWGYSFRLGSARAWFVHDAEDARAWLVAHGLLTDPGVPTWRLRGACASV